MQKEARSEVVVVAEVVLLTSYGNWTTWKEEYKKRSLLTWDSRVALPNTFGAGTLKICNKQLQYKVWLKKNTLKMLKYLKTWKLSQLQMSV